MNIIAFSGSNSQNSINQKLVTYVSRLIENSEVINLINYDIPMFSVDLEKEQGTPKDVKKLFDNIISHDHAIISVNEYNSNVSAFFKNITDWLSRVDRHFLKDMNILLLSTSTGARGGMSALEITKSVLPRFGCKEIVSYSFPSFNDNYNEETLEVTNNEIKKELLAKVQEFKNL